MPLLWLSLAFLSGIILANNIPLPTTSWLILAGAGLVTTVTPLILKQLNLRSFNLNLPFGTPPIPIPVLLIALSLGGARFQSHLPDLTDPHFIAAHNDIDRQMMVTGVVEAMPDVRDRTTYLRVQAEYMHPTRSLDYTNVSGLILVSTTPGKTFDYGDRVLVRGHLETPPESEAFSYRDYLARQGVYTTIRAVKVTTLESDQGSWFKTGIYQLKKVALETVYQLWPDPEASLFAGILLGVETNIPEPVQQAFKTTGTSHIIAISGFNIAIVAGLFSRMFGRVLGMLKGGVAALIAIAVYTVLVGADAAVVRAAIMGGLSLFAGLVGRRQSGVNALAFTAAAMSMVDPHIPWDVGFQLSFAATLGLVLYADPLATAFIRLASRWLPEERAMSLGEPVGEFFLFTLAAQVTTLPILAYHFGAISWMAFLANPIILPVQPPVMILGGISLILGTIWNPLGVIAAWAAWPFMVFTIRAVELFGKHTGGILHLGKFSLLWVIGFYILLLSGTFRWQQISNWITARRERIQATAGLPIIAALSFITVLTWRAVLTAPDGELHLTLLAVGTGDAILIKTPNGRYALVDGGPSTSLLSDGLGRRLPPFHRELDWLIIASPSGEQIGALPRLIDRFPPSNVLWAGLPSASREADYLREGITSLQIPVTGAKVGQTLNLGDGASLRILAAGNRGAILLLEWDRFRALLPLGVNDGNFELLRMGKEIGQVTILLLAENGYAPANPPEWIENLNPQLVLLSVASDDQDGLPDRGTLDALSGFSLLRTDQNGWIHITTNGKQMWVEAER